MIIFVQMGGNNRERSPLSQPFLTALGIYMPRRTVSNTLGCLLFLRDN